MKTFLPIIITLFGLTLFASDAKDAMDMAKMYERNGDIKNAMEQYKKAALLLIEPQESYIKDKDAVVLGNNSIKSYGNKQTDETVRKIIYSAFDIRPYKINYLLPATYDNKVHDRRENTETKFQLSFKKSLAKDMLGQDDTLYIAYTQTSWWQTAAKSAPFRETNYEPEIFFDIPYNSTQSPLKSYKLGFIHQSNGRLVSSRSWNRVYVSSTLEYKGIFFKPRVWYRFKEDAENDDNSDILDYLGYGDIDITYPYEKHLFSTTLRKRSVQLDWTFPLFGLKDVFGYIQIFGGYGESLIDYDKKVEKIGLGFAITR